MAFEITKVYKENFPACRFIGKRYVDEDRVKGMFGAKWGEWFQNGWFAALEAIPGVDRTGDNKDLDSYIGLCRCGLETGAGVFEYWIGMFFPENTEVPDGFTHVDLPAAELGIAWIYGSEDNGEIYGEAATAAAWEKLETELGVKGGKTFDGFEISFERYNCPRFTEKDEKGNVTLDYGFYLCD